jgi:arsenate reductase
MRISGLARLVGVAPSAIRYYESRLILPVAPRTPGGYRDYGPEHVSRLRLIVALRRLGLAPDVAGDLAAACGAGRIDNAADHLTTVIADQRQLILRRIEELRMLDGQLEDLELTASATSAAAGQSRTSTIDVLFVCTGNSARSQMAEALLRHMGGTDFVSNSAGTQPRPIHPLTLTVLGELGIDWTSARSKAVDELADRSFDYVITVCDRARKACPSFRGEHDALHWGLDDPAAIKGPHELQIAAFRRTAHELAARLEPFVELARAAAPLRS